MKKKFIIDYKILSTKKVLCNIKITNKRWENFMSNSLNNKNKKLNILIISQYYYPEQFRINDICEGLVKQGHHVTVLTGLPNYPEGVVLSKYKNFKNRKEIINDVYVIRSFLYGRGKGALKLFLNYLSFMISACLKKRKLPKKNYDAIFVYEISPVTQIFPGYLYKRKFRCPLFVNCQDVWPEVIKVYNIEESSLIFKLVKKFSIWLYRKADRILVSSEGFIDYLHTICKIAFEKMEYLPNHAEEIYLNFSNQTPSDVDNMVNLLFAGNIGKAQDLDTLVKAVSQLSKLAMKKVIINIVGEGSYMAILKSSVIKMELNDKFVFHGKKKLTELKYFYEKADAYILTLEGNTFISKTVPAKLQGYMGAGKPILAAIDGQAKIIIEKANCGLCVNAGDNESYAEILEEFILNIELYRGLGNNGRDFFNRNFTLEKYIERLLVIMRKDLNNV